MNENITDQALEEELTHVKAAIGRLRLRTPAASPALAEGIMEAVAVESARAKLLAMASDVRPPSEMTGRIMEAVAAESAREKRNSRRIRAAVAAVAGMAAVLAIAFLPLLSSPPATAPASGDEVAQAISMAEDAADWLAAQQCEDGSWSPAQTGGNETFRPALTALALMALQRHAPVRHAAAIERAAHALEAMQTPDGAFSTSPSSKLYNHAFVTFALLGLRDESDQGLSPVLQRAVAFSLKSQNHFGAWDYTDQEPGNTALTVWQLGLLLRARNAGWEDDNGQLRRGLAWLKHQGRNGMFDYRSTFDQQYTPYSGSITLTAMATSTLLDAAVTFPELAETADNAVASLRAAYGREEEREAADHYRDYFLCRVFHGSSDTVAERELTDTIAAQHSQTTSRVSAPWKARDVWAATGGDLYATVMAMLSVHNG